MVTQAKKGGVQQVQGQLELQSEIQLRKKKRNIQCVLLHKNEPSELLNGFVSQLSSPARPHSHILLSPPQQCYYAIRIFAGQDPSCVWVGWVTPDYHLYSEKFDLNKNCTVTVTLGDERGRVHER